MPIYVDGMVLDSERSGPEALLYKIGGYPMLLPGFHPNQGYAIALCNACRINFVVEFDDYSIRESRVVWTIAGVEVPDAVPKPVRYAVRDAKLAAAVGSITGALMSMRTAVERTQRHEEARVC